MKKYIQILSLAIVAVSFASCLKDKNFDERKTGHDLTGVPKVIEVGVAYSTANSQTIGLNFVDVTVDVAIVTVRLAANDPATEDITVTLDTVGTQARAVLENDSNFNRLPRLFTYPAGGLSIIIPKGKREANLIIKTNASKFDPSSSYGILFTLKAVDKPGYVLSGNFNQYYTVLGAKNPYDGLYKCEFTNYHPTLNPNYTGGTYNVEMRTVGPNSVKIWMALFNSYANPAFLNGALSGFGSQEPEYTINPTTNVVTVQNTFPGGVTFYTMNPTFNSRYDPVDRIIYTRWGYGYVGGNFSLGASRDWTQKLTYLGPR